MLTLRGDDFVERVNNELVANWGNLVNRVLGFAYTRWNGVVPEPGPLSEKDQGLLDEVKAGFHSVGDLYEKCEAESRDERSPAAEPTSEPVSPRRGSLEYD